MTSNRSTFKTAAVLFGVAAAGCSGSARTTEETRTSAQAVAVKSKIQHLVVIIEENWSFDQLYGNYCTAAPGSNPTCNTGPGCCEARPAADPTGCAFNVVTDGEVYDPSNSSDCETQNIDNGKMDGFCTTKTCGSAHKIETSDSTTVQQLWTYAGQYAIADRWFQSSTGGSIEEDLYFSTGKYAGVLDNTLYPANTVGLVCVGGVKTTTLTDKTVGELLDSANVSWDWYGEGYAVMKQANPQTQQQCPAAPRDCGAKEAQWPCDYDPSDNPFNYYASSRDTNLVDLGQLHADLYGGTLPSVAYVKPLGYHTFHPGYGNTIHQAMATLTGIVDDINASPYAGSTLILMTYDESGGFFDHVAPPPNNPIDDKAYGPRVPLLAMGTFAKSNYVSHVPIEPSSIIRFIEWNWLNGATGQLAARDTNVNNIGDLLDPKKTGAAVPSN
jgi:phospholipase C